MMVRPGGRELTYILVPGQSRLRGRSRRHPSLATDALAVARAVWTPCLPRPRPAYCLTRPHAASPATVASDGRTAVFDSSGWVLPEGKGLGSAGFDMGRAA